MIQKKLRGLGGLRSSQRGRKSHLKNTVPSKEPIPTWNDII